MDEERSTPLDKSFRRRDFVVASAATGLALAGPLNYAAIARQSRVPFAKGGKFKHGVAAGFPSQRGATLWTRLSGLERRSKLTLEVARDKGFRKVVKEREVVAAPNMDFTLHERIGGLKPGKEYFYRFATKNKSSRVGRFRTLAPPDSTRKVKIGFYSCQSWEAGFYNAQAGLAEEDLDLVVCLGDYIYERIFFEGPAGRKADTTGVEGNVQTLEEYREKYRLYQSDKDLQDMHAAHAFVSVWDDHEVEDNYAGDEQDSAEPDPNNENNGQPRRIPFLERRRNGYKAFFEAMPRVRFKGDRNRIYGSLRLGGLAERFLTDQRQYRDPQPCMDAQLTPCPAADDPGRKMLGDEQKAWFKRAVPGSNATWKLWGSEVMLMSVDVPAGQPAILDAWDAYAAERQEILDTFRAAGVQNLAAVTGDIHTFFAGDLSTTGRSGGRPIGVELVCGSATSPGIPEALNVPSSTLEALAAANNPHIKYDEYDSRGYGVVTVTKDALVTEFKTVDIQTRGAAPQSLATITVDSGVPAVNVG